jgi:hypothetical protein
VGHGQLLPISLWPSWRPGDPWKFAYARTLHGYPPTTLDVADLDPPLDPTARGVGRGLDPRSRCAHVELSNPNALSRACDRTDKRSSFSCPERDRDTPPMLPGLLRGHRSRVRNSADSN